MTLLLDFSYGKWLFLRYSIVMRPLSCVAGLDDWKTNFDATAKVPEKLSQGGASTADQRGPQPCRIRDGVRGTQALPAKAQAVVSAPTKALKAFKSRKYRQTSTSAAISRGTFSP